MVMVPERHYFIACCTLRHRLMLWAMTRPDQVLSHRALRSIGRHLAFDHAQMRVPIGMDLLQRMLQVLRDA